MAARLTGSPAARRPVRPRRCPTACAISRSAPIRAARCGRPRTIAACSASARPMAGSASKTATTSRPPSTPAATLRATARPSRGSARCCSGRIAGALPDKPRLLLRAGRLRAPRQEVREALAPALRADRGGSRARPRSVDVATEGFTALYWAMRHIQGREAWRPTGR